MDPIGTATTKAGFYQDTSSLRNLRGQEGLEEASKQFEAIFLQMTLKSMRDASDALVGGESLFSSQNQKFYQEMADAQLAVEMGRQGGLGIADAMVRQLGGTLNNEMKYDKNSNTMDGIDSKAEVLNARSFAQPLNTVNLIGEIKP